MFENVIDNDIIKQTFKKSIHHTGNCLFKNKQFPFLNEFFFFKTPNFPRLNVRLHLLSSAKGEFLPEKTEFKIIVKY